MFPIKISKEIKNSPLIINVSTNIFKIFQSCYVSKLGNKILKFVLTNVPMNPKPQKSTPLPQHPNLVLTYLNEHTRPFPGTNKFPKVVPIQVCSKNKSPETEEKKERNVPKVPKIFVPNIFLMLLIGQGTGYPQNILKPWGTGSQKCDLTLRPQ
jgi:hypothetical protein